MQKSNPFSFSEVYDDHFTMDDVATLHTAARLMKVSAGEFIMIAHIQKFREKPDIKTLRSINNAFVFKDQVPIWAKDFAEDIIEQCQKNTYDGWTYGLSPGKEPPRRGARWRDFQILIPFLVTFLLYAIFN